MLAIIFHPFPPERVELIVPLVLQVASCAFIRQVY